MDIGTSTMASNITIVTPKSVIGAILENTNHSQMSTRLDTQSIEVIHNWSTDPQTQMTGKNHVFSNNSGAGSGIRTPPPLATSPATPPFFGTKMYPTITSFLNQLISYIHYCVSQCMVYEPKLSRWDSDLSANLQVAVHLQKTSMSAD